MPLPIVLVALLAGCGSHEGNPDLQLLREQAAIRACIDTWNMTENARPQSFGARSVRDGSMKAQVITNGDDPKACTVLVPLPNRTGYVMRFTMSHLPEPGALFSKDGALFSSDGVETANLLSNATIAPDGKLDVTNYTE
jgi:hypothetical protein